MEHQVFGGEHHSGRPARPLWTAMWNGFRGRCPKCGQGRLFASFIKTEQACAHCGQEFHHHRAVFLKLKLPLMWMRTAL